MEEIHSMLLFVCLHGFPACPGCGGGGEWKFKVCHCTDVDSQRGRSQSCPQDEFKVQQQHRAELLLTAWWTQTSFIQELRSVCTFCLHASRGSLTHIDARLHSPPVWVAGFDCVLKMLHSADVWVTHGLYFSKIQIDVAPAVERLRLKFNKHSKILHLHEENLCQTKALLLGAEISWWS